jgi:hypothetical protein
LLAVWILLGVPGFRLVLARGWHGARPSMRTVGWVLLMFCAPSVTSVLGCGGAAVGGLGCSMSLRYGLQL